MDNSDSLFFRLLFLITLTPNTYVYICLGSIKNSGGNIYIYIFLFYWFTPLFINLFIVLFFFLFRKMHCVSELPVPPFLENGNIFVRQTIFLIYNVFSHNLLIAYICRWGFTINIFHFRLVLKFWIFPYSIRFFSQCSLHVQYINIFFYANGKYLRLNITFFSVT